MNRNACLAWLAAAVVAMASIAGPVAAQVTTGTVNGTITDAQGGVLPGATVVLVSEGRGTKMVPVVTNAQGAFVIPNVSPDTYRIEVMMPGFKNLTRAGVAVSTGDRLSLPPLALEIGGASETVNVTASAQMIQAQSGERSFTVATDMVQSLPINNRSNNQGFVALAALAPGVDGTTRLGGGGQNNAMMDGVSTMDTGNNQPILFLNTEAVSEVKVLTSGYQAEYGRSSGLQITAVTKSGSNQFRGSVYDVMRDSDWNSNSWANKQNGQPKAVNKETDWGYTIGGPIGRPGGNNKVFFFFSQEWRPRKTGSTVRQFRFPTALERNGDFSQTLDQNGAPFPYIRDASKGTAACSATALATCFNDGGVVGRVPTDRLYQVGLNLLRQYPTPTMTREEQMARGVGYNYETSDPIQKTLNNQPAFRVDYSPSQSLRTTVKYAGEMQRQQQFLGTLPGYNDTMVPHPLITTISATANYSLTPTTFLEATYGITQNEVAGCTTLNGICRNAIHMNDAANKNNVGLANLPVIFPEGLAVDPRYFNYKSLNKIKPPYWQDGQIFLQPNYSWGNRVSNAPPSFAYPGWNNINRVQDVSVSMTMVKSNHTWKLGFYNQHSFKAENRGQGTQASGSINFGQSTANPLDSQFGYSNAALGIFQSMSQQSRFMEGSYVYNNTEGYIQDNWKVNRQLTLDYGVRIVRQQPQHDALFQASNFLPETWDRAQAPRLYVSGCATNVYPCTTGNQRAMDPANPGVFLPRLALGQVVPNSGNTANGMHLVTDGRIVKTAYKWPLIALAPRFGMAYDVSGAQKLVLRGGAGLFFDRPQGTTIYSLVTNPPVTQFVTLSNGDFRDLGSGLRLSGAPQLSVYEYEAPLPSSVQWNGGAQIALPWSSMVDLSYVGQHGYNLLRNVNINQVEPGAAWLPQNQDPAQTPTTLGSNAVPDVLMRPFKGYANVNMQLGIGYNTYHSIQTSFNRRFVNGLSFTLNHTLALSNRGNGDSPVRLKYAADGSYSFRDDQDEADELLSQLQMQRNTFKGTFSWDLPDVDGETPVMRALGLVVNDWQLSGVASYQTGNLYSVGYSYVNGGSQLNITGSPNYSGRVLITGDHGGTGCSSNQYQQFNTSVFQGPPVGSVGLESGQNYLTGCWDRFWDFSIARNIRFGGTRQVQLRVDMFNAFDTVVFTGRSTNMSLTSPTNQTITNPQYDAAGQLVQTRLQPNNAGFGAVTGAANLRTVQAQVRFQF